MGYPKKRKEVSDKKESHSGLRLLAFSIIGLIFGFFMPLAISWPFSIPIFGVYPSAAHLIWIVPLFLTIMVFLGIKARKPEYKCLFFSAFFGGVICIIGIIVGLTAQMNRSEDAFSIAGPIGPDGRFVDNCKDFCETKDYVSYCTLTMNDITGSIDWNRDKEEGQLVKDKISVWDFCEDRVYCFLVTDCPAMSMDQCREYMCQRYTQKYGDVDSAVEKMQYIYKASDSHGTCYRENENGEKTFYNDLAFEDRWLYAGFEGKGWCNSEANPDVASANNLSNITLANCLYDSFSDSITCDTNCLSTVSDRATVLAVLDKNSNMSLAMDGHNFLGQIAVSGGKVTAKPAVSILFNVTSLSGLDQDTSMWIVSLNCKNPEGKGVVSAGVKKVGASVTSGPAGNADINPTSSDELVISNCLYDSLSYSITCDTNCQSGQNKNAYVMVVESYPYNDTKVMWVGNMTAWAYESPNFAYEGRLTFSPGKLTLKPEHYEFYDGSIGSISLSEFNRSVSTWWVHLTCENPTGFKVAEGVSEIK